MAVYVIGTKDVTVNDIKDVNPAPEQTIPNHPLGNPYVRLGKANGQQTPALHFSAGSTVELPNTSDVKESQRGGQLKKLIAAGLVAVTTTALLPVGTDIATPNIKVT